MLAEHDPAGWSSRHRRRSGRRAGAAAAHRPAARRGGLPAARRASAAAAWGLPTATRRPLALDGAAAPRPADPRRQRRRAGRARGDPRLRGECYCDETLVLRGAAPRLVVVAPGPAGSRCAPGGSVGGRTAGRGRCRPGPRRVAGRRVGRAVQVGCEPATVLLDGVAHPRPVRRWSWYRHTGRLAAGPPRAERVQGSRAALWQPGSLARAWSVCASMPVRRPGARGSVSTYSCCESAAIASMISSVTARRISGGASRGPRSGRSRAARRSAP